uniref:Uncharacterized protein n=1 Tax=Leersia perrieri TaxID=77586 RepID=A0A0D9XIM7_9ORYZ
MKDKELRAKKAMNRRRAPLAGVEAKPSYGFDMVSYTCEFTAITDEPHVSNAQTALRAYNDSVPNGGDRFYFEDLRKMATIRELDSGLTYCHFNFLASC